MIRERTLRARQKLVGKLPITGELLRGSLLERTIRHTKGCPKCARGEGHHVFVLTVTYPGARRSDIDRSSVTAGPARRSPRCGETRRVPPHGPVPGRPSGRPRGRPSGGSRPPWDGSHSGHCVTRAPYLRLRKSALECRLDLVTEGKPKCACSRLL